jgi:restriction system protein
MPKQLLLTRRRGNRQRMRTRGARAAAPVDAATQAAGIDDFRVRVENGDPEAIRNYFALVMESSSYPDIITAQIRLAYVPESKQLVVEYELPGSSVVPLAAGFKYVKSTDSVTSSARPASQRKALYASVIAHITLRTLSELYAADRLGYLDTVVFNGHVNTINPGTGHPEHPCLVTVRTTADIIRSLDLTKVEPIACLKALNASISKSPSELSPVRPVLEFDMVDPRFVEQTDVLATLDQRPNLMELTRNHSGIHRLIVGVA